MDRLKASSYAGIETIHPPYRRKGYYYCKGELVVPSLRSALASNVLLSARCKAVGWLELHIREYEMQDLGNRSPPHLCCIIWLDELRLVACLPFTCPAVDASAVSEITFLRFGRDMALATLTDDLSGLRVKISFL